LWGLGLATRGNTRIDIKDISLEQIDFTGWGTQEQARHDPLAVIDKVLDDHEVEVIGGCEFKTRLRLCKMADLNARLKTQGLATTGLKNALIKRLVEYAYGLE
jgi:hypothetical protein